MLGRYSTKNNYYFVLRKLFIHCDRFRVSKDKVLRRIFGPKRGSNMGMEETAL
jgi:hypothetical protein